MLSYNLLADAHRHRWDDPRDGIHTYCAPALTAAARRLPRLLEEVLAFRADVLCLQEGGEVYTVEGVKQLEKGTYHRLTRSVAEPLIAQGVLQENDVC